MAAVSSADRQATASLPEDQSEHPEAGDGSAGSRGSHGWKTLVLGAGAYLLLSVFVWSSAWHHPTSTTTCGCGDTSLFTWFLEWSAYAISHGLNPFYSTAIHVPTGVNLLANTSVVAIGVLLAPITWLFGPIATLNVALTLAPALSALSMFVLLRRWVTWSPAAFVGGLLYGFSPFILFSLGDAHLMLGMLVIPPLIVACLDELLFRQRRRPVPTGIVLGLLITVQFFIGTEVLVITVGMGLIGMVIIVGYAAWRRPSELRRRARHATVGLSAGLALALVLLAGPASYALFGPAHFGSQVWPGVYGRLARRQRTSPSLFLFPMSAWNGMVTTAHNRMQGGYQGPALSYQYFGTWMVVVLLGGVAVWRHDRRLWLFGAIAVISGVLSLGTRPDIWLPWQALQNLPLLENVVPYRLVLVTYLAVAVMLGLIVEHVYVSVNRLRRSAPRAGAERTSPWTRLPAWTGAGAAAVVAVIALVQPASYLAQTIPMTTVPVAVPTWFTAVAPHLPRHQVLLIIPAPFTSFDNSMTWQALDKMDFSMVGEGGPGGMLVETGTELKGAQVIAKVSSQTPRARTLSADGVAQVRQALHDWRVTMVVLPDQPGLPAYDQIHSVTLAAALITAATGRLPVLQANAWVWAGVEHSGAVANTESTRVAECTTAVQPRGARAVRRATACVLASPGTSHPR
jgi:hypothetical protein